MRTLDRHDWQFFTNRAGKVECRFRRPWLSTCLNLRKPIAYETKKTEEHFQCEISSCPIQRFKKPASVQQYTNGNSKKIVTLDLNNYDYSYAAATVTETVNAANVSQLTLNIPESLQGKIFSITTFADDVLTPSLHTNYSLTPDGKQLILNGLGQFKYTNTSSF